tara:strand:- start:198 stop:488 length:291 start_codon:yes stop_codon:yes gene_type:complete
MISLIFIALLGLAIWTGITLFKKGPKDKEIKSLLKEMLSDGSFLIEIFMKLFTDFKNLFQLLRDSTESKTIDQASEDNEVSPKLVELQKHQNKEAA